MTLKRARDYEIRESREHKWVLKVDGTILEQEMYVSIWGRITTADQKLMSFHFQEDAYAWRKNQAFQLFDPAITHALRVIQNPKWRKT